MHQNPSHGSQPFRASQRLFVSKQHCCSSGVFSVYSAFRTHVQAEELGSWAACLDECRKGAGFLKSTIHAPGQCSRKFFGSTRLYLANREWSPSVLVGLVVRLFRETPGTTPAPANTHQQQQQQSSPKFKKYKTPPAAPAQQARSRIYTCQNVINTKLRPNALPHLLAPIRQHRPQPEYSPTPAWAVECVARSCTTTTQLRLGKGARGWYRVFIPAPKTILRRPSALSATLRSPPTAAHVYIATSQ